MVYLQDNVGWSIEEFLDEPWMLTWRGSWINPKYLFAGVSSLVNAFSTGWRIFCSMFVSYYSHYRVYHNYCQLRLIILIYCHLGLIVIYCHLSSLFVLLFLGAKSQTGMNISELEKEQFPEDFLIKKIASLQNFESVLQNIFKKNHCSGLGQLFTGLFYASLLLF